MKTEFLNGFLGKTLDEEMLKEIQAESGKDVTATKTTLQSEIDKLTAQNTELQSQLTERSNDITGLQQQLENAGQSATKLADVQKSFAELQQKYDDDAKAWSKKLEDQQYSALVSEATRDIKFSSKASKKMFIEGMMKDRLPLKDGALLGFDQYLSKQKEDDPESFVTEEPNPTKPKPNFAPPTEPQKPPQEEKDIFGFGWRK